MSSSGFTSGDPLGGGSEPERRHESGLPMPPPAPSRPAPAATPPGYTSPPPPGAGGLRPAPAHGGMGDLVLAGWGRRVVAALIDGLIVVVIALVILIPLGIGLAGTEDDAGVGALIVATLLTLFVLAIAGFLYAPILMAKTNGQTLGRMAASIRVVRTDRARMTFGWAFLREVAVKGIAINMVGGTFTGGILPLLDVLWPLWDEENRALHDFAVQTRTVMA